MCQKTQQQAEESYSYLAFTEIPVHNRWVTHCQHEGRNLCGLVTTRIKHSFLQNDKRRFLFGALLQLREAKGKKKGATTDSLIFFLFFFFKKMEKKEKQLLITVVRTLHYHYTPRFLTTPLCCHGNAVLEERYCYCSFTFCPFLLTICDESVQCQSVHWPKL